MSKHLKRTLALVTGIIMVSAFSLFMPSFARTSNRGAGSALIQKALKGDKAGVRKILRGGADPNAVPGPDDNGMTALMAASWNGDVETVGLLLEAGAEVDAVSETGATAILYASYQGHAGVVDILLEEGNADTDILTNAGTTALSTAVDRGFSGIARTISLRGGSCNIPSNVTLTTPLMKAALRQNTDVIQSMMDSNCDIEMRDRYGKTALVYAVQGGSYDNVAALLNKGADPQTRDNNGITVLAFARVMGRTEIASILEARITGQP